MEIVKKDTDFTDQELEDLEKWKKGGRKGITALSEADIFQCFNLYMSGKTYKEIADTTNKRLECILYVSEKSKWYGKKMAHYDSIAMNLEEKLMKTKLDSVNTITNVIAALGKYYNSKFDRFLSTNDPTLIEDIDTKLLAQYYKALESLPKIIGSSTSGDGSNSPSININMPSGAKIEKLDDNTVEITDEKAAKLLKALAAVKKDD